MSIEDGREKMRDGEEEEEEEGGGSIRHERLYSTICPFIASSVSHAMEDERWKL